MSVPAGRSRSSPSIADARARTSRSGTRRAVDAIGRDRADAAGRRGDERRARRHDLHHRIRKAVDVSRIVVHRRSDGDVGRRKQRRHDIVRDDAEKLHGFADAGGLRPGAKRCFEIAVAGNGDAQPRVLRFQRGSGVDQIFESLFLDEAADGKNERYIIRDAEHFAAARARVRVGLEPLAVDAVGNDVRSPGVGAYRRRRASGDLRCTR